MARLVAMTPMIWTREVEETLSFYVDKLGFTCEAYEKEWGWASLRRDAVQMMVSLPNEHMPFEKPGFTGSFYIFTDDVEEIWESVRDEVELCYPIETYDYGMREFGVYDNNGYIVQFGQDVLGEGGEQPATNGEGR